MKENKYNVFFAAQQIHTGNNDTISVSVLIKMICYI